MSTTLSTDLFVIVGPDGNVRLRTLSKTREEALAATVGSELLGYRCVPCALVSREGEEKP